MAGFKITPEPAFKITPEPGGMTIAPKGGEAYSATPLLRKAMETYDQLTAPAEGDQLRKEVAKRPATSVANENFWRTLADNALATPAAMTDVLTYPVRDIFNTATKGPKKAPMFSAPLQVTPRPTTASLAALVGKLYGGPTEEDIAAVDAAQSAEFPTATALGEMAGDTASLIIGKAPFSKGAAARAARREKKISSAAHAERKFFSPEAPDEALASFGKSGTVQKIRRWAGRTGEAAAEGAVLGLIKGQDPVELAGWTAGANAGAGILKGAAQTHFVNIKNPVARFVTNSAIMAGSLLVLDGVLPGEDDLKDYEALDKAMKKGIYAVSVGLASGLVAGRARSNRFSALAPKFMDAITSAPRHALTSTISAILGRPPEERKALIDKVSTLGDRAGELSADQIRKLNGAIEKGGDYFLKELEQLQ